MIVTRPTNGLRNSSPNSRFVLTRCGSGRKIGTIQQATHGRYFCPVGVSVRIWLKQAEALVAWRELQPELEGLSQDVELRDAMRDLVVQLQELNPIWRAAGDWRSGASALRRLRSRS